MGQKTNPNILRLGNTKQWKSKYIEKKPSEYAIHTFQDLEIQHFLQKLLNDNGLMIHSCQSRYFENSMHIYLSYYIKREVLALMKNQCTKNYIKSELKQKKLTRQFRRKYFSLQKKTSNYFKYIGTIQKFKNKNLIRCYNRTNLFTKILQNKKKRNYLPHKKRIKFVSYYKLSITARDQKIKTLKNLKTSLFWNRIAKTIQLFVGNSTDIILHFRQLSVVTNRKFTNKQVKMLKKIVGQLRKYRKSSFFREGINLIFTFLITNQSSNILATFIATELRKQKRHNFFLSFIKTTLKLLNQNRFTTPKRIMIKIKGRFNGAPRAKHRVINIGENMPNLSIQANIENSETTSFTQNGTFGVKVWTLE